jgi:hypothetical protein
MESTDPEASDDISVGKDEDDYQRRKLARKQKKD